MLTVRRWEAGEVSWPLEPYRLALRELTHEDPEDMGFVPTKRARVTAEPAPDTTRPVTLDSAQVMQSGNRSFETGLRRREFVGLSGAALFGAVLNQPERPRDSVQSIDDLAAALVEYFAPSDGPTDLASLAAMITQARENYQASQYSQVIAELPSLLRRLRAACTRLDGDALKASPTPGRCGG